MEREKASVTTASGLLQNYPNPFNPATSIRYTISRNSLVTVIIYDAVGREVVLLVHREQGPGSYSVIWDAHASSSGVYLCRLQAEGRTWEKRIVCVK
ncbi:MAG TPA: T9SS type A sorting domain-containing protein [Bacteroidota bacterium]